MFLSKTDARERNQNLQAYDPLLDGETGFGEVFAASVGTVFDEELSISSGLNNDMYSQREATVKSMTDGGFDLTPYTNDSGLIDYDRLANETDAGLKTDRELYDERNSLLEMRRNYSNDVKERGSGMAQFFGGMSGYMLDPVNVATLPIGASASALRGLGTLARVSRVAAIEGGVAIGAEALIQPFVFAHKNEINSPYSLSDSLMAIGTAAIGGAAIGGAAAGAAGFLRSVGKIADDYPNDIGAQGSRDSLNKLAADMEANPDRSYIDADVAEDVRFYSQKTEGEILADIEVLRGSTDEDSVMRIEAAQAVLDSRKGRWSKKVEQEVSDAIDAERARLTGDAGGRISRGERKTLAKELDDLLARRNRVEAAKPEVVKAKGKSARKAKTEAIKKVEAEARAESDALTQQIDAIEARLESSRISQKAEADLSRAEAGIYGDKLQELIRQISHRRLVSVDIEYARKIESTRVAQSEQLPTPETYDVMPDRKSIPLDTMDAEDLARYDALGDEGVIRVDGENTSAKAFIDERTAEIDGLESVRSCSIG